jgi:glutathione S-transferase
MPSRAVLLLIRTLGLDVELKNVDLLAGEQKSEDITKLNPVAKIPILIDTDGFTLSESRAILAYLVNSRRPGSDLYPSDPKKRALIDQRLYFDATEVFSKMRTILVSYIFRKLKLFKPEINFYANN